MRSYLRLAACFAVAACGQADEEAAVTLNSYPAPEHASAPAASVESGQEAVRVQGLIAVPDRCQSLSAEITRNENDVGLWVMYDPAQESCPEGELTVAYTAEIHGLRPGRYNLRVIHGRSGMWRGTEPVLVHPIVVPQS